jgi:hypothetical protein
MVAVSADSCKMDVLGTYPHFVAGWDARDPVTGMAVKDLVAGVCTFKKRMRCLVAAHDAAKDREGKHKPAAIGDDARTLAPAGTCSRT